MELDEEIRAVLAGSGRLAVDVAAVDRDDDLFALGLDSHGAVELMVALEERLGVEFPDRLLTRATFRSIAALAAALAELLPVGARP
ncbi:MAG: acyl carrier protein [Geminicoccaceae bacterium]|nr:acyl carrier protein [Geminicoccaceae bacterium]MDW8371529.1 acyl carrier protein [Geminicoccaceae bacterium]